MKTATVEELRDKQSNVLGWVKAGEGVAISQEGEVIAWLVPPDEVQVTLHREETDERVDWTTSAAFTMDRSSMRPLTAEESAAILDENKGKW